MSTVAHQAAPRMATSHTAATVQVPQALHVIQLPGNAWKGTLWLKHLSHPHWETQVEFRAPGFDPVQPQLLQTSGEWTRLRISYLLSPTLSLHVCLSNKDFQKLMTLPNSLQGYTLKVTWIFNTNSNLGKDVKTTKQKRICHFSEGSYEVKTEV